MNHFSAGFNDFELNMGLHYLQTIALSFMYILCAQRPLFFR